MTDPARVRRHAERIRELVASVVRTQIKDPRLGMLTITDARITADLRDATVFYTVLGDSAAKAGTAAALLIGIGHVRSGLVTLGELLMVMGYLNQLYAPLRTISQKAATLQLHLASAERAFALLDEPVDVEERREAREELEDECGRKPSETRIAYLEEIAEFRGDNLLDAAAGLAEFIDDGDEKDDEGDLDDEE